jgi:HEAT repeat protein
VLLTLLNLLMFSSAGPAGDVHDFSDEPAPQCSTVRGRDIVLITVDALRADRLGAYGYRRGHSPRIDGLASESIAFERSYASSPSTSFSIASIMLGRHAYAMMHEADLGDHETLADQLARVGYRTAAIFPPAVYFSAGPSFAPLRQRHFGFSRVVHESLDDDLDSAERTDQAIQILTENAGRHVFLWVHYFAPHEPYTLHPTSNFKLGPNPSDSDRYDGEVAWVDREIGRLLDHIGAFRPDSVVVLTADHGEEFGEHGGAYHGTSLYDEQLRVPLIIRFPGFPPRREPGPVSTADLSRILESLFTADATSMQDDWALRGSVPMTGAPVFAEIGSLKSVVFGQHKAICDLWTNTCRLFDLDRDPQERMNLAAKLPDTLAFMRRLLDAWVTQDPRRDDPSFSDLTTLESTFRRARRGDRQSAGAILSVATNPLLAPDTRTEAARLLTRMVSPKQGPALRRTWTTEASPLNRWLAVSLARLGDSKARQWLAKVDPVQTHDEDAEFGAQRAVALARRQDPASLSIVVQALQKTFDANLRCLLFSTLSRLGGDEARVTLLSAYDDVRTRFCVATALERLKDPGTVSFLREKTETEPYVTVRAALVRALRKIGGPGLRDDIKKLQAQEQDPLVLAAASSALRAKARPGKSNKSRWSRTRISPRQL